MAPSDISKKNIEVIFNSIITDNEDLHLKIKEQFPDLNTVQTYTALILKLGYSFKETRIILGISEIEVEQIFDLFKDSK
jgi:hypothetical protein